jgi:hypothetical protein
VANFAAASPKGFVNLTGWNSAKTGISSATAATRLTLTDVATVTATMNTADAAVSNSTFEIVDFY